MEHIRLQVAVTSCSARTGPARRPSAFFGNSWQSFLPSSRSVPIQEIAENRVLAYRPSKRERRCFLQDTIALISLWQHRETGQSQCGTLKIPMSRNLASFRLGALHPSQVVFLGCKRENLRPIRPLCHEFVFHLQRSRYPLRWIS